MEYSFLIRYREILAMIKKMPMVVSVGISSDTYTLFRERQGLLKDFYLVIMSNLFSPQEASTAYELFAENYAIDPANHWLIVSSFEQEALRIQSEILDHFGGIFPYKLQSCNVRACALIKLEGMELMEYVSKLKPLR